MDNVTLTALEESIIKWKHNVWRCEDALAAGGYNNPEVSLSAKDCPLCLQFNKELSDQPTSNFRETCEGCPVFERTTEPHCDGTPYYHVVYAADQFDDDATPENLVALLEACQEEVAFLESLRPAPPSDKTPAPTTPWSYHSEGRRAFILDDTGCTVCEIRVSLPNDPLPVAVQIVTEHNQHIKESES